jgi:hypothetical protein
MFPVYYDFLESIGKDRSRLALELLTGHEEVMAPFVISLMRGLWMSAKATDVEQIARGWISEGRNLSAVAKSLYSSGSSRLAVLSLVVDRAVSLDDRYALMQAMGVAAGLFSDGAIEAKVEFMRSLRELGRRGDTRWARAIWFNADFKSLVGSMNSGERAELLLALTSLPELDYQAEDLLYEVARQDLQGTIDFLVDRLAYDRMLNKRTGVDGDGEVERFEVVPHQLHRLGELLRAVPSELLRALRGDFAKEDRSMFSYRGARLVRAVYPTFGEPIEAPLLQYVGTGNKDDIEFVVGILRTYDGSASILEICRAIVKIVPEHSRIWSQLVAAIETTGVVTGEYGILHAYERKLREISDWTADENERVRTFAQWYTEGLRHQIEQERQRADEGLALRKYRFGSGSDDG